jgi:hypothetical protein
LRFLPGGLIVRGGHVSRVLSDEANAMSAKRLTTFDS